MRELIRGFGLALAAAIAAVLTGCGGSIRAEAKSAEAMPPPSPAIAPKPMSLADGAPARAMAAGLPGASAATEGDPGASEETQPRLEMLDIEGSVTLQVTKVRSALRALHSLSARVGGVVTQERLDASAAHATAQVTLRLPSGKARSVLDELSAIGRVLEQSVEARQIGKEYFDAKLRLSSLEVTLHRYEEILAHAAKVEEILRIEQELGRLRAETEQVKGNLRWLADRAARATLQLTLLEKAPVIAHSPSPQAKFYPGFRLAALVDFGKRATDDYLGGGLTLRFSRLVSLDLDILKRAGSDARGADALLATVGGETYSELLGGGERRFLNPYLGWRAGYARLEQDNQALLGVTIGLELYKNRWFGLDAEARHYLAIIGDRGAHYALSPALSARLAF